ncbi:MAG: dTDP-4-dehydrorhamnose 3,5-epimerase [Bacteroidetes bacterium]|nr:dTDP-4-dehydrorhamnose 3,5-epimerase [Bacteroidota bacterium]
MDIKELDIQGCFLITPKIFKDERGSLVKTFHESSFHHEGISFDFKEEYYSISKKGVIRGMHFQIPPHDHIKMVYCPKGVVFDTFVDLRKGSPTYLQPSHVQLSEENGNILVLAKGIAHGFCSLEDGTIMIYKTSSEYEPNNESGILWDSCGIDWPSIANSKLLSARDKTFLNLKEFDSPFNY